VSRTKAILELARKIDRERTAEVEERLSSADSAWTSRDAHRAPQGTADDDEAFAVAVLLAAAYPSLATPIFAEPEIARTLVAEGFQAHRDREAYLVRLHARAGDPSAHEHAGRELRRTVRDEKIRIALREVLPLALGGADVDVTAREHAFLAEAAIEVALAEAVHAMSARYGEPRTAAGDPARFVVLGMGKLGGEELNAGSDIDLIYLYDTDDGAAKRLERRADGALHEFWTRVAQAASQRRSTTSPRTASSSASISAFVPRGAAARSSTRSPPRSATTRPSGGSGSARRSSARSPSQESRVFGEEALAALEPFVFRRRVDPRRSPSRWSLARRARADAAPRSPERDLKLGPGGIREAEFFVQTLRSCGAERSRAPARKGTLDAIRRLRAAGFVTDREAQEIALGYIALRRAEHAVQVASGIQTHARPRPGEEEERLARALGFAGAEAFAADIGAHMATISARFLSLLPEGEVGSSRFTAAIAALERASPEDFALAIAEAAQGSFPARAGTQGSAPSASEHWADVARDLLELARHPDAPLGTRSQESFPLLAETVLGAVLESADPEQAARYLRIFFARVRHPGVYVKILGDDPRAVRRLVEALGASAFIGDALANNPELGDALLFAQRAPTPEEARAEVQAALAETRAEAVIGESLESGFDPPEEALVTALRRAKARVTLGVGLADLASEIDTRNAMLTLSALADAELEAATRFALGTPEGSPVRGLAVLAMGKLGGREIGYGSDLDVLFLFDPEAAPPEVDAYTHFAPRGAAHHPPDLRLARRGPGLRARHAPAPLGQPGPARHLARGLRALPRLRDPRRRRRAPRGDPARPRRRVGAPRLAPSARSGGRSRARRGGPARRSRRGLRDARRTAAASPRR
jgi:glutamate-ammonia-ligase adenylyltransferase